MSLLVMLLSSFEYTSVCCGNVGESFPVLVRPRRDQEVPLVWGEYRH